MNCESLTNITLPENLTKIGINAFNTCSSLTKIVIPDSVVSIGKYAFYNCKNLTIESKSGSYVETYAKENNIPFSAI